MSAKPTYNKNTSRQSALNAAFGGGLLGISLILAYIEAVLPLNLGVSGIKLGLANMLTVFVLYRFGAKKAAALSGLRILISAALFGSPVGFVYSLAGGLTSLLVMVTLKKTSLFSPFGVSVAGGIAHNAAQIAVAAVILNTFGMVYLLPLLTLSGTVAGGVIGVLAAVMIKKIPNKT